MNEPNFPYKNYHALASQMLKIIIVDYQGKYLDYLQGKAEWREIEGYRKSIITNYGRIMELLFDMDAEDLMETAERTVEREKL